MQLIPATARRFGVSNVFNPVENIQGGARYLRYLLDLYHWDYPLALAAYNAGEGAVAKYGGVPPLPGDAELPESGGQAVHTRKAKLGAREARPRLRKPRRPRTGRRTSRRSWIGRHGALRFAMTVAR